MNFAAVRNHAAPTLFLAILLGVPLSSSACGRTACFSWSTGEGACPAQNDALRFFSDPKCPGNVLSVDSEGSSDFEGRLCCYAVTQNDIHFDEGIDNTCISGSSSSGISPGSGVGAQGAGGFGSSSVSFASATGTGGSTVMPPCIHCADTLASPLPPDASFCSGEAKMLFFALSDCVCNGACAAACGDNACSGFETSFECGNCMKDEMVGCGTQLNQCASDL